MTDPVRARRAQAARLATFGLRLGYGLFAAAAVLFTVGLLGRLSDGLARAVIACLVAGSTVLAPAMILGYAARAAEREDRKRGV